MIYFGDFVGRPAIALGHKRNPETGVLTLRYPISYVGLAEYTLGEIRRSGGGEQIPAPYSAMPDSTVIKVLHRPEQVSCPAFVETCYRLPIMRGEHAAEGLHMLRAGDSSRTVGLLGTALEMREVGGFEVPTLDAAITCPETQRDIEAGADESSLSYVCGHDWTGGEWQGERYHMEHILDRDDPRIADLVTKQGPPRANHLTAALRPGESRGYRRTVVFADSRSREPARYAEPMLIPLSAAAAKRLPQALAGYIKGGRVADGPVTLEVPDGDLAAVQAFVTALAGALGDVSVAAEASAGQVAQLEAAMPELEADAAFGRQARAEQVRAVATGKLGVPAEKIADKLTADEILEAAVLHTVPSLREHLPPASRAADRRHAIKVAWLARVSAADDAAKLRPTETPAAGTRPIGDTRAETPPPPPAGGDMAPSRAFLGLPVK